MTDTPKPEVPSMDDMADTLSASYRTMRDVSGKMESVLGLIFIVEILVSLTCGVAIFYLLHRLRNA